MKSEFCLKPFPVLLPVFSKERKILPSVVRREIGVFVGPLKAPFGGRELGIGKEFTFLEGDLPWILLENLCLQGVQSTLMLYLIHFPNRVYCSLTRGKKSFPLK